jgi:hypothetical protein
MRVQAWAGRLGSFALSAVFKEREEGGGGGA